MTEKNKIIAVLVALIASFFLGLSLRRPAQTITKIEEKIEYRDRVVEVEKIVHKNDIKKRIEIRPDGTKIIDITDNSVVTEDRSYDRNIEYKQDKSEERVSNHPAQYRGTVLVPIELDPKFYMRPTVGVGVRLFGTIWADGQFNFKHREGYLGVSFEI